MWRASLNNAIIKNEKIIITTPVISIPFLFLTRPVLIFEWSDKIGFICFSKGFENDIGVWSGFFGGKTVILKSLWICRSLTFIGLNVSFGFQKYFYEIDWNYIFIADSNNLEAKYLDLVKGKIMFEICHLGFSNKLSNCLLKSSALMSFFMLIFS